MVVTEAATARIFLVKALAAQAAQAAAAEAAAVLVAVLGF
jgi:hypothetical protein